MKLLSVLVVFQLILLTAACEETSFSSGSSIFGNQLEHFASVDNSSSGFIGHPFGTDYSLRYFPESSPMDSTPYNSHNLFAYGSSSNNSDPEGMTSNDARVQGWTPFLQTHFGSYNVVPEPGTFALFGLASLAGAFWFRRKN